MLNKNKNDLSIAKFESPLFSFFKSVVVVIKNNLKETLKKIFKNYDKFSFLFVLLF